MYYAKNDPGDTVGNASVYHDGYLYIRDIPWEDAEHIAECMNRRGEKTDSSDDRPEPPQEWTKTVRLYFVGYDEITALQGPAYMHESTAERIARKQDGAGIYWCDVTVTSDELEQTYEELAGNQGPLERLDWDDLSPPPGYTGPWAG